MVAERIGTSRLFVLPSDQSNRRLIANRWARLGGDRALQHTGRERPGALGMMLGSSGASPHRICYFLFANL